MSYQPQPFASTKPLCLFSLFMPLFLLIIPFIFSFLLCHIHFFSFRFFLSPCCWYSELIAFPHVLPLFSYHLPNLRSHIFPLSFSSPGLAMSLYDSQSHLKQHPRRTLSSHHSTWKCACIRFLALLLSCWDKRVWSKVIRNLKEAFV